MTACLPHILASATYICLSQLNSLALTRSLSLTHMYTVLSAGVQGLSLCKRSDRLAELGMWTQTQGHARTGLHSFFISWLESEGGRCITNMCLFSYAGYTHHTLSLIHTCKPVDSSVRCSLLSLSVKRHGCIVSLDSV